MMDIDWGQIVNGGAGLISVYLATQIKSVLRNHDVRITALERRRARAKKAKKEHKSNGHANNCINCN